MLAVVFRASFCHPPCRCIGSGLQRVPDLEHAMAGRLSLGQDDLPGLPPHRGPELGVQCFDVQIARPIGAGFDSSELDPGLGQPCSEVGDEIGDRPVWVAVVAGPDNLRVIERVEKLEQLVPSGPLGLDLGIERVVVRRTRFNDRYRHLAVDGVSQFRPPHAITGWRCETYPPTGCRKPTARRFQPLIATIASVRATCSSGLNWRATSS
jgi:hypothetical protein